MPVSKNAYKRYLIIHNFLNKSLCVPKKKERILEILEDAGYKISASMFEKDIETMRNTFDLPIKYHREQDAGGYHYAELDVSFDIPMSDEVVKTIYGALKQLALFQNTTAFRNAKESLQKIMTRLEIDLKRPVSGMEDIIFYESQTKFSGSEWIAPIYDAIVDQKIITFTFRLFDKQTNHIVEPYALKEISGRWYILGSEDEKVAVYGLDRVIKLKISDHYFTANKTFRKELHAKIRNSVGHLDFTKRTHEVRLLYDSSVADEVLARKIHETQRNLSMDEHNLLVSVKVSMNEDFVRKAVLPYGDKVTVIGPCFATDLVLKILNDTLHKYDDYVEEREKAKKQAESERL
ncbi:MAG: WYL domain-containing protein [Bacteroidota bacterium]